MGWSLPFSAEGQCWGPCSTWDRSNLCKVVAREGCSPFTAGACGSVEGYLRHSVLEKKGFLGAGGRGKVTEVVQGSYLAGDALSGAHGNSDHWAWGCTHMYVPIPASLFTSWVSDVTFLHFHLCKVRGL